MQAPEILFHQEVVVFTEDIKNLVQCLNAQGHDMSSVQTMVNLAPEMAKAMSGQSMVHSFIFNSYPYWDEIHQKKETFFVDNFDKIFGRSPLLGPFKEILLRKNKQGQYIVEPTDRENIWSFLTTFVQIALLYCSNYKIRRFFPTNQKDERKPVLVDYPKYFELFYNRKPNPVAFQD